MMCDIHNSMSAKAHMDVKKVEKITSAIVRFVPSLDDELIDALNELKAEARAA